MRIYFCLGVLVCAGSIGGWGCKESENTKGLTEADREMLAMAVAKEEACFESERLGAAFVYFQYEMILSGAVQFPEISRTQLLSRLKCIASADDCAKVITCSGGDVTSTCDPLVDSFRCDGDKVMICAETPSVENAYWLMYRDCSVDPNGNNTCGDEECVAGSCEGERYRCEGDVAVYCRDGVMKRENCALDFRGCTANADNTEVWCEFNQKCGSDLAYCDGNVAVSCTDGANGEYFVRETIDCAALGASCVDGADGLGCRAEESCEDFQNGCVGNTLRFCDYGREVELDCDAISGGVCKENWEEQETCLWEGK